MHWTYEDIEEDGPLDLAQGDILEPNVNLTKLFQEVHPHFSKPKYLGFLVLTQSCDLVQKYGVKATHITLAVIRSLQDIISTSLKDNFGYLAPGIYAAHRQKSVELLAERLINQNENMLGLFYLHTEADLGISTPSVAILRVTISVKAEHYPMLQEARVGRLSKEFQAKLGWMVGNLFSRVGVSDWKEKYNNSDVEKAIIRKFLSFYRDNPVWLQQKQYKKIVKTNPDFESLSIAEQDELIKQSTPLPPKEKAVGIITKIIKDVAPKVPEEALNKIKHRLINNEQLEAQMRKFGA